MRRFAFIVCIALLVLPVVLFDLANAQTVLTCRAGAVHVLSGRGPAHTAVLLLFDTVPVGGGTTDAQGTFQVRLVVGSEAPGDYQVAVETRASHQLLLTALCRVPGPSETDAPTSAPAQPGAPSATATATAIATATTASNREVPSATTGTSGASTASITASATASASPTLTATDQSNTTNTPTATGQRTTATVGSAATATTTATPTRTTTSDSNADAPELTIDIENDQPLVGDELLAFGDLTDANNDGIARIAVTVTFTFEGGSGQWCTATTDDDGYWECTGKVTGAMNNKDVTLTAKVTVNGRTIEQEATMTPGDEET